MSLDSPFADDQPALVVQDAHHIILFQAALAQSETPSLLLDRNKIVIGASNAACLLLEDSLQRIVGKPIFECGDGLFARRDPTSVELPLMALLHVSDDGPLAASSKLIQDAAGNSVGWIVTLYTANQRQRRRQRRVLPILPLLQEYFIEVQRLLVTLPSLLMRPDEHQNGVIQMQRLMNDMIIQVQRLVLLQSIEAQGEVQTEAIQIGKLIQQVVVDVRTQINRRGITLTVDIPEEFPPIVCHVSQIRLALRELLQNVLEHATGCTTATIRTRQQHGFLYVSVQDNGLGMSQEEQARILDLLVPQDGTAPMQDEHLGFGLALARAVVRAHHGRLRIESEPGRGSVFTLILPIKEKE